MSSHLGRFEGALHVVVGQREDWGVRVLDLAALPRRLAGHSPSNYTPLRTPVDPYQVEAYALPAEQLNTPLAKDDTWSALTRRSLARFEAFFLVCEDPQRRLESREVVTLAHQVSLVRHILDSANCRKVLIGDEVGLGKTVVAGLIINELLEANPGLRVLYLAPARLVSNVGREFRRLSLLFREWKAQNSDARLETDTRIIASIHRAVHPNHLERLLGQHPWDVIVVDECHHLSDWADGGGDPVQKYRLVRDLVASQPSGARLLLMSGTPHQAHEARFDNLLKLLRNPGEAASAAAGRVIYRTKDDVRDWNNNPLFPLREVHPPIVVELEESHRQWLTDIHHFFKPPDGFASRARQRAAGWKCAQALQWAASSPNAGLGYLVRQALRAGWKLSQEPMREALAAMRPYRSGTIDEPVEQLYHRLLAEIKRQAEDDDVEDIEECVPEEESVDRDALAGLINKGIRLVRNPVQQKWDCLWEKVLKPAGREKVVLFAQPIETVLALAAWLKRTKGEDCTIIIGGQSDDERDQQVARFRDEKGPRFLISSRAGGEGINLQFARRLVHLDVPWNPMEMEQRVGRVHRFGSRETVLVDTLVVKDSRETQAWNVARQRLLVVANTLVAPERFDAVFSRVMCLIPPEELQTVLIGNPDAQWSEEQARNLSSLVDAGFQNWQRFHDRYADNQRSIRNQPAGRAQWRHVRDFVLRHGNAKPVSGITSTQFVAHEREVHAVDAEADVVEFVDGSRYFVGDSGGVVFRGQGNRALDSLGLNIPHVAGLLNAAANPSLLVGAAQLRWGNNQKELRASFGREVVFLAFARQSVQLDTKGGVSEVGLELLVFCVQEGETAQLLDEQKEAIFNMHRDATVRIRPAQSALLGRAVEEEHRLLHELRRPSDEQIRQGLRYAVWPILAAHISD